MVSKEEVPEHWEWEKLGNLVNVNPRYDLPDQNEFPHVPMKKVSAEDKEIMGFERKDNIYSGLSKFKQGDVLFARITPCTENGKAAYVEELPEGEKISVGSSELAVLSPNDGLNSRYLYYLIQEPYLRSQAINQMKGASGRKRVPYSFFREDAEVPVPPLEEQKAIVGTSRMT
ncbi:restriction endonuclease subunit S [Halorubrum vacuolatum]|uniref:restriction endonuclease subunit S n=1 Tax=Halorubrum vacuolatum TaxID=63740 RepID=UPI000B7806E7|nr:restriction endonuclease subunit S [Halorubrum vacuolatum]